MSQKIFGPDQNTLKLSGIVEGMLMNDVTKNWGQNSKIQRDIKILVPTLDRKNRVFLTSCFWSTYRVEFDFLNKIAAG